MTWFRWCTVAKGALLASMLSGAVRAADMRPEPEARPTWASPGARDEAPIPSTAIRGLEEQFTLVPVITAAQARQLAAVARDQEVIPVPGEEPSSASDKAIPTPNDVRTDVGPSVVSGQGPTVHSNVWNFCNVCCDSGLIFGVEGTFLAPFNEPSQTVILTDLVTEETFDGSSHPGLGGGIRTWLGIQRGGWGFRVQYWHFGNDTIDVDPTVPLNAEPAFHEAFVLNVDTLDVELIQRLCFGLWNIDASFGARYTHLTRNSTVVGYGDLGGGVNLYGLAMGANEIEGAGFTFSLSGRKPLDSYWLPCGWHTFWSFRGSLLWADSTASVLTEANAVVKPPIGAGAANSRDKAFASKDHSEDVFITEAQLGLEYERRLCCLPATFFFRVALEYQHWETGDVEASSNSFAFLEGGPPAFGGRVDAFGNAHDGDLDLIGLMIGAGWTY